MSKLKFESRLLFADNAFSPAGPELVQTIDVAAEWRDSLSDAEAAGALAAKQYDNWATDISVDLRATTGLKGEAIGLQTVRTIAVAIVKTAADVTGSVSITLPQFGITSGAINIGNMAAAIAATPVGGVIHFLSGFNAGGMAVGATNIAVDFTSPVGFAVKLIAIGDVAD